MPSDLDVKFLKLNGTATYERCRERESYWTSLYLELEGCEHPVLERLREVADDSRERWRQLRLAKEPKPSEREERA